jgi:hypothetical protein
LRAAGRNVEIARTANTLDPIGSIVARTEFPAEVVNVRVDAAIEWREIPSKHIEREQLAADDVSGGPDQRGEQIELGGCKRDDFAVSPDGS